MTGLTPPHIVVRPLDAREWASAFSLVKQLRNELDEDTYLHRLRLQTYHGYVMVGAFADGHLAGLIGLRPVHSFRRGSYMHVDDLVVDEHNRHTGIGAALMTYAESDAKERRMTCVFLDARPEAMGFYERLGYAPHTSPSMRKMF